MSTVSIQHLQHQKMHRMEYVNNLSAAHSLSESRASKNKVKILGKDKQIFKNAD